MASEATKSLFLGCWVKKKSSRICVRERNTERGTGWRGEWLFFLFLKIKKKLIYLARHGRYRQGRTEENNKIPTKFHTFASHVSKLNKKTLKKMSHDGLKISYRSVFSRRPRRSLSVELSLCNRRVIIRDVVAHTKQGQSSLRFSIRFIKQIFNCTIASSPYSKPRSDKIPPQLPIVYFFYPPAFDNKSCESTLKQCLADNSLFQYWQRGREQDGKRIFSFLTRGLHEGCPLQSDRCHAAINFKHTPCVYTPSPLPSITYFSKYFFHNVRAWNCRKKKLRRCFSINKLRQHPFQIIFKWNEIFKIICTKKMCVRRKKSSKK